MEINALWKLFKDKQKKQEMQILFCLGDASPLRSVKVDGQVFPAGAVGTSSLPLMPFHQRPERRQ